MKVAALTAGESTPSTRFRIRQHIKALGDTGIIVRECIPLIDKYAALPQKVQSLFPEYMVPTVKALWEFAKVGTRIPGVIGSWQADVTWLTKGLLKGRVTLEPWLKRPLVFDVDDATWQALPHGDSAMRRIAQIADVVVAGNLYIAEWFSAHARDVRVVPTAVDTDRWRPRDNAALNSRFVIGWTGISGNYGSLYEIEKPLGEFLKSHNAELMVISDRPPKFKLINEEKVCYLEWSPGIEAKGIQSMDVGIMPLRLTSWNRCKCSFKMLQYMACGIPVVVSPVGMNVDVLALGDVGISAEKDAEWYEALDLLYSNDSLRLDWGINGRTIVEERFSRKIVSAILAQIFKEFE